MKLIITGASGFIGSYLCKYFSEKGFEVVGFARKNIEALSQEMPYCSWMQVDVLDDQISSMVINADAVIHLAAANDIISKIPNAAVNLSANGTRNLLQLAIHNKIPNFIFFSTLQVYGTELNGHIDEKTPTLCRNDYGLNHLFGEQYVEMYSREKGIRGVVVRPSNVYGRFTTPSIERWTLVPGCFCKEIFNEGTITLLSSGKQTRNFVGLHEVSAGVEAILRNNENGFDIYNLASNKNLSMLAVAEMVKTIFENRYNRTATINVKNGEPKTGNSFAIDLKKLQSIGYNPDNHFNLETEINQIFDHLEKLPEYNLIK